LVVDRLPTIFMNRFKETPGIVAIAGDRILDRDYRTDGWDNAPVAVTDVDDIMLPTIVIVHSEAIHELGSPSGSESETIIVWAFSSRSSQGMNEVRDLLRLAKGVIHEKHIMETKGMPVWQFALGPLSAPDGSMGQSWYRVSGIPPA
jgi:hypothetical protein